MSLKNLKSVFTEGLKKFESAYTSKVVNMNSRYGNARNFPKENMSHEKIHTSQRLDIEGGWPGPANFVDQDSQYAEGFTIDFDPGTQTKFNLSPVNLPILNQFTTIPFVVDIGGAAPVYDTINYGSNAYKGTRFDDNLGGLFNSNTTTGKYSTAFGVINTPKGYADSPTGNDIITLGNINTNGGGYVNKQTLMDTYIGMKGIEPETRYRPGGDATTDFTNADRQYIQDEIPSYNNNLDLAGDQMKSFEKNRHRKIKIRGSDVTTESLGQKKDGKAGWSLLYERDHEAIEGVGYYYPNVNRDKLNIRTDNPNENNSNFSRRSLLGKEPYIISRIPSGDVGGLGGGRITNIGSRTIPIVRAVNDTLRLTKFLASPLGIAFIASQNIYGIIPTSVVSSNSYEKKFIAGNLNRPVFNPSKLGATKPGGIQLMRVPQRFNKFYDPSTTLGSAAARVVGGHQGGVPNILFRKDEGLIKAFASLEESKRAHPSVPGGGLLPGTGARTYGELKQTTFGTVEESLSGGAPADQETGEQPKLSKYNNDISKWTTEWLLYHGVSNPPKPRAGDRVTLSKILPSTTGVRGGYNGEIISGHELLKPERGLKFYFKDLRNNKHIFFRAYITGLTENITPTWTPHNYIGRSEPVYTYGSTERSVTFNLKLFAHTYDEFLAIYKKMNYLTSLCYPEYHPDDQGGFSAKMRMKPPLTKFVLGDYLGRADQESNPHAELGGFLKSLTYNVPDESPWEAGLDGYVSNSGQEHKLQAPKYIIATITYQVIHATAPSLDFAKFNNGKAFYGVTQKMGNQHDISREMEEVIEEDELDL